LNQYSRNAVFWVVLFFVFMALFRVMNQPEINRPVPYSQFLEIIDEGAVREVVIENDMVKGVTIDHQQPFESVIARDHDLADYLISKNVDFEVRKPAESSWALELFITLLPMLLFIGVWLFFMRQMQIGAGKGMSFGKSKAKLLTEDQRKVTFDDVAGVSEAQQEVQEIIEFLKDPKKFTKLGGRIPKGVLLVGPPGTGKTLIARAIAGEAGVPFFSISGSDFVEMFVGVGASRVRDLFIQGKKNAPCIIFIDEIDAVGRHRGAGIGGGHDEREQTLNQLLVEMDGFESNEGVILIAATNRPDVLDPALLRPGRFDRRVVVQRPDVQGRLGILKVHAKRTPLSEDVDLEVIARGTPGFSGAELEILVNEAALWAARNNKDELGREDFEYAKDKVMMGTERRSMVMTEEDKALTAYHEAGHAIVGLNVPKHDPLHKVTIIPRGRALGVTMSLPERDKYAHSKIELVSKLAMMFGGRIAEELQFGAENVTTGAGNDIQQATQMARRMVTEYGFSDKLGPLRYSDNEEEVFLGHSVARQQNVSDATAELIDQEVRQLIENAEKEARRILTEKSDDLETLAKALLEYETLSGEEVDALLRGESIVRPDPEDDPAAKGGHRSSVPTSGASAKENKDEPPAGFSPEPQPEG